MRWRKRKRKGWMRKRRGQVEEGEEDEGKPKDEVE